MVRMLDALPLKLGMKFLNVSLVGKMLWTNISVFGEPDRILLTIENRFSKMTSSGVLRDRSLIPINRNTFDGCLFTISSNRLMTPKVTSPEIPRLMTVESFSNFFQLPPSVMLFPSMMTLPFTMGCFLNSASRFT